MKTIVKLFTSMPNENGLDSKRFPCQSSGLSSFVHCCPWSTTKWIIISITQETAQKSTHTYTIKASNHSHPKYISQVICKRRTWNMRAWNECVDLKYPNLLELLVFEHVLVFFFFLLFCFMCVRMLCRRALCLAYVTFFSRRREITYT